MQLCLRLLPGFWNRLVSTVSSNRTDRTTPSGMHALPFSFITSCVKTNLNRAVSSSILQEAISYLPFFSHRFARKKRYPTPENPILHHILHPKLPVNTGYLWYGCRKCRFFTETFFSERRDTTVRKMQNIGLLQAKVRRFCLESTEVCIKEVRCFYFPKALHIQKAGFANKEEHKPFSALLTT